MSSEKLTSNLMDFEGTGSVPLTSNTGDQGSGGLAFTSDPFAASDQAEVGLISEGGEEPTERSAPEPEPQRKSTFNPVGVLKNYFDVDTNIIFQRTFQATVKGYSGGFTNYIHGKQDLYGPFWITATLVVVSSISGSFAQYLSGKRKNDVDKVTASLFTFYGYVTLLPLLIWGLLKYYKNPLPLVSLVSLYGYSMAVFIPAAIFCTIPIPAFRWIVILLAAAVSGVSITMNLKESLAVALQQKSFAVLAGLAGAHIAVAVGLKLYFFMY
mmetsp:Transcript_14866/g.37796  ORF Transcript_14866/g.37796 Transcript_14866/m.37796 type:complete len:269 (+) Transcript_14866:74-880(+)